MSSLKDLASLIMVPSLYKDGRLDTVKPLGNGILHPDATGNHDGTDGSTPPEANFTFSRGSNLAATRVDVNGLIEKGRENLLLQSNNFDTTPWGGVNASVTPNATTAPDGTLTASKIVATPVNAQHRIDQGTTSSAGVKTFSVYLKQAEITDAWLRIGTSGCFFDLTNGAISSISSGIIASVEALANDWYRCSITKTNATANEIVRINAGVTDYLGDNVIGVFVWRAQYEEGLAATDYIETGASTAQAGILEDMPRLDYSGGASCPSLLLEPQRSNVVSQSEYFGAWNTNGTASVTDNQSVSPEGVSNAALLDFGSTTLGANRIDLEPAISAGANYVFSVFVKNIDANRIGIRNYNTTKDAIANFDFSSGSFTDTNVNVIDTIVEPFSNGWYRIGIVFNSGVDTTADVRISPDTTSGSDGEQIYVYGASIEQGSYPTSYIPTYGSSVTRGFDSCVKTSATDLIGQSEGVAFCEVNMETKTLSSSWAFSLNDGSTSNYIGLRRSGGNELFAHINVSGTTTALIATGITTGTHKIAIAYANNDIAVYVDGVSVGTDTSSAIPATSVIEIGDLVSNRYFDDSIKQFVLFKTRLTNTELAALTTL